MCQALSEAGIKGIAIFDVQDDLGMKAASDLSAQTGVDVKFYKVDVRDEAGVQSSVQRVVDHFGQIDVLISSAGIAE
jgi:NAD(P)-dependent dehydrogenase (short-subunit alcohol dehydrogenase family)